MMESNPSKAVMSLEEVDDDLSTLIASELSSEYDAVFWDYYDFRRTQLNDHDFMNMRSIKLEGGREPVEDASMIFTNTDKAEVHTVVKGFPEESGSPMNDGAAEAVFYVWQIIHVIEPVGE